MRHQFTVATGTAIVVGAILFGLVRSGSANDSWHPGSNYLWESPLPQVIDPTRLRVKLSTLGEGWEYRHDVSPVWNIRLESLEYSRRDDQLNDMLRTEKQINLRSSSLLFDWLPFEGRFRATSGIYFNRGEFGGNMRYVADLPSAEFSAPQINRFVGQVSQELRQAGYSEQALSLDRFAANNGETFSVEGRTVDLRDIVTVSARLRLRPYAPYAGFGWASANDRGTGLFYSVDAGLMFLGRPHVEFALSGSLAEAARLERGPELDALVAEQERRAGEKLSKYRHYPILSFSVWYLF